MIHPGGQAAVVVPVAGFLRLRALAQAATPQELEDAEDSAAVLEWKARDAAGQSRLVPADEARPARQVMRVTSGLPPADIAGGSAAWHGLSVSVTAPGEVEGNCAITRGSP